MTKLGDAETHSEPHHEAQDADKPEKRSLPPIWLPQEVFDALEKRAASRGLRATQHVRTLIYADLGITSK